MRVLMANVEVKFKAGYVILMHHIKDRESLAYALDLFDAIEETRERRDFHVVLGELEKVNEYEARRNRHITALSKLVEEAHASAHESQDVVQRNDSGGQHVHRHRRGGHTQGYRH